MAVSLSLLYEKYKDKDITFNQRVITSLGLIVNQIAFKCAGKSYSCILYSSSMSRARLLVHLEKSFFETLRKNRNSIALRFTFKPEDQKSAFSFFVNSKVKNFNQYNCGKPDLYFLNIEFINNPPNDLIEIFGEHIQQEESVHERIHERVPTGMDEEAQDDKLMENFLFVDGKGKRCILTEISIFSAKIIINGKDGEFDTGRKVMLLMKAKGLEGVGEMVGTIKRVEIINKEEGLYSVIIVFDQDKAPPSYKMWVGEYINLIMGQND